ncbi:hypothetical protein D3878_01245 [Noviherbaspirillum sedimenti]|uniref:Uncharacterized protein n=1 Tax=Noviherbaspirillum sedimenti TaxID=2320865 RepID=A0A3A3GHJ3_9BURK|nr:hypothetical protein D3878_01245 [Noviherbaspirillum sedimenti]
MGAHCRCRIIDSLGVIRHRHASGQKNGWAKEGEKTFHVGTKRINSCILDNGIGRGFGLITFPYKLGPCTGSLCAVLMSVRKAAQGMVKIGV